MTTQQLKSETLEIVVEELAEEQLNASDCASTASTASTAGSCWGSISSMSSVISCGANEVQ
jgi:hypothetical protein